MLYNNRLLLCNANSSIRIKISMARQSDFKGNSGKKQVAYAEKAAEPASIS